MKGQTLTFKEGSTSYCENERIYVDPRNKDLGAKIITKIENAESLIKTLNLKKINKEKYYEKSFNLGIPQINLDKLKEKLFGIESNLDELNGIDFKKGCYIGQENTSRIKLRNKLRRRILPIKKISGEIHENDIIKYNNNDDMKKFIVEKGSIAINGISLTISNVSEKFFSVSIIPHTFNHTNLYLKCEYPKAMKPESQFHCAG